MGGEEVDSKIDNFVKWKGTCVIMLVAEKDRIKIQLLKNCMYV